MIYIDGLNQTRLFNNWDSTYKGSAYSGGLPTSDHDISIGRRQPASWGSLFFEGNIDEVRIFDRVLPPEEILEHATKPGERTITLSGVPDNSDVGINYVEINITDGSNNFETRSFSLTVENVDPVITTENVLEVFQDEEYNVEYDADDEGLGSTSWELVTDASWLTVDEANGLVQGTPSNDDVGIHDVEVIFHDGNGGSDSESFSLNVKDVNDGPTISTVSLPGATEDQFYEYQMEAVDIDGEDLTWDFESNADWLETDSSGYISGTPENSDVGHVDITATVTDPRGLFTQRTFGFEVANVNDKPVWIDVPENTTIDEGDLFTYDYNASDEDAGDLVTYEINSFPETDITIDASTGEMSWLSSREPFSSVPYVLKVRVEATDGEYVIRHDLRIDVNPNTSPEAILIEPLDEAVIGGDSITLVWEGKDTEMDEMRYHLFFSDIRNGVTQRDEDLKLEVEGTSRTISDLVPGTTYYWTVIPEDDYSTGYCLNETFSFYVNTAPKTDLTTPGDGSRISPVEPELRWVGTDIEDDVMTYDLYLGTIKSDVEALLPGTSFMTGISGSSVFLEDLLRGSIYFWTVIPSDIYSLGYCVDGVNSFITNNPPVIDQVLLQQTTVGVPLVLDIQGSDEDPEDISKLVYSIDQPLNGMSIDRNTGLFEWIPGPGQIGTFTVTIHLTDGIDTTNSSFDVNISSPIMEEDEEEEDEGSGVVFIVIAILVVILIIIGIGAMLLYVRKRKEMTDEKVGSSPEPGPEKGPLQ
jgi:hypothetical protein